MSIKLVDGGWGREFADAVGAGSGELCIICPFIKAGAVEQLLAGHAGGVRVITRFRLTDFAACVSDAAALRRLLDAGATVRGVRNLHAKLYIFGERRAIITSANLTQAGLRSNHEFGVVADGADVVAECRQYFDSLWERAGADLLLEQVNEWDGIVAGYQLAGGRASQAYQLKDFGVDVGIVNPTPELPAAAVAESSQAFVKFTGRDSNRRALSDATIEEVKGSGVHWAVTYSKRPRRVENGAVIFVSRFTSNPNDIRIFGLAIGMKHEPDRDDATPADIEKRPWKERWPYYIRLHNAEFVAGTMQNGISLNELMDELGADSFARTQQNAIRGNGNTNPRRAYRQLPAIELSQDGFRWLNEGLQAAFETHGRVPQHELDRLDWPDSP